MNSLAMATPERRFLVLGLGLASIGLEVLQACSAAPLLLDVGHGAAIDQALNFALLLVMFVGSVAVARGEYLIVASIFRRDGGGIFGDRAARGFAHLFFGSVALFLWRHMPGLI